MRWLAPADPAHLPVDLLRPFPAEEIKAWKVGKAVGNTRNDNPSLIEHLRNEETVSPSLFE
jgi:putative SOS response-associated peptidase YedK